MLASMYQAPVAGGTDTDAAAWATAVTAAGGTYSGATLAALSTMIASLKANGVWSKMKVFNPMCGNQLAACLVQYTSGSWAQCTSVNFVSGDYTEATGLTGNGASKYLNTGFTTNTLTANSTHLAVYNRAASATGGGAHIGSVAGSTNYFDLFAPYTDGVTYSDQYGQVAGRTSGAIASGYGLVVGSRTASNAHAVYKKGSVVASNSTSEGALNTLSNFVFAWNNNGTPGLYSSHPLALYSIGDGLTSADVTSYNTAVQAFQTSLGRQV